MFLPPSWESTTDLGTSTALVSPGEKTKKVFFAPSTAAIDRQNILRSVEESLARLQTSCERNPIKLYSRKTSAHIIYHNIIFLVLDIDLLYTHVWDYGTPLEETLETLHWLVQQGKVKKSH